MSRHSKLTPQIAAQLVAACRTGSNVVQAARLAGCATSTVYDWLHRGQRERAGAYHALDRAISEARAHARRQHVDGVATAAQHEVTGQPVNG